MTNVIQSYQWTSVQWPKAHKVVQNLRQRIFRATKAGDFKKVKQLQKLMLRCTSNASDYPQFSRSG